MHQNATWTGIRLTRSSKLVLSQCVHYDQCVHLIGLQPTMTLQKSILVDTISANLSL